MVQLTDEVREKLREKSNVVGVGKGKKMKKRRKTDEDAIIVFVKRKLPEDELDEEDLIPSEIEVEGESVKTDVVESGEFRPQGKRENKWRPAPGGVSVGPEGGRGAGTMGTPLLEDEDGDKVILTNRHVVESKTTNSVIQPGVPDGGSPDDVIGEVKEMSPEDSKITDSAVIRVDDSLISNEILGLGSLDGWTEPKDDKRYKKSGRRSGITDGELIARDYSGEVGETEYEGLDIFQRMSLRGDSGALICEVNGDEVLGTDLLFAGDFLTVGIPISTVFEVHGNMTPVKTERPPKLVHSDKS